MRILFPLAVALAGCANPASQAPTGDRAAVAPVPAAQPAIIPTGVSVSASGHGTILDAPSDPRPHQPVERERPVGEEGGAGWYAHDRGITLAEARERLDGQQAKMDEAMALRDRLQREEPDNFLSMKLRHQPDWAYVYFFKRDPAATLARYTSDPRFHAQRGQYSSEERRALIEPWRARWNSEGIDFGYGLDAVYPTMDVQLAITAAEYAELARDNGWESPPPPIVLKFMPAPIRPAVDPVVAPLLKGYALEKRHTLMQLEALGTGKLVLEDGCLMVGRGEDKKVAVFHFETGIALDDEGYLVLVDRMDGSVRGRVGEDMAWAAPNAIPEGGMVGLEELRAACPGELLNIGNPESMAAFDARYPETRAPGSPPPPPETGD